jgi:hypothetical protein
VDLSLHGGVLQTGFIKRLSHEIFHNLKSLLPAVELPLHGGDLQTGLPF